MSINYGAALSLVNTILLVLAPGCGNGEDAKSTDGGSSTTQDAGSVPESEGGVPPELVGAWYASGPDVPRGEFCVVFCQNGRHFFDESSCSAESPDFLSYLEYSYSDGVVELYSAKGFYRTLEVEFQGDRLVITTDTGSEIVTVVVDRVADEWARCTSDEAWLADDVI